MWGRMRVLSVSGLAERQVLVTRISHDSDLLSILYTHRNFPVGTLLKIYDKNILKIDSKLSLECFYYL